MSFSELVIGEVCEVGSSKRIYASEYKNSGIPFYRSKEVIQKARNESIKDELYIGEDKFVELENKFGSPKYGDILLASIGANLGISYFVNTNYRFYFKDGNVTWFKNFSEKLNSKFLYYWLNSQDGQNKILNSAIGSAQKALTIDGLKKLKLNAPMLEEQEAIADTLSCLDDKIGLNNSINKTLEEMAQAIFKSWFVDFEPLQDGEFEDSEFGRIPQGWRVDNLGNCTSVVIRGIAPKYADISEQYVINQKCIRDGLLNTALVRPHSSIVKEEKKLKFGDILINSTGVGTLGRVAQVYEELKNYTVDSHVTIVRPNISYGIGYLGCLLKSMQTNFEHEATGSTGQTELGRESIRQMKILIPNDMAMGEFSEIYDSLYNKVMYFKKENNVLTNIRDSLLPKLMSGEIRVPIKEV